MEVKLISHTPEPELVVAAAARLCYSPRGAAEIMDDFSQQEAESFLGRLLEAGHSSPWEHASFTFAIAGVSRALSHQLVRHRIGVSFSQKSQRYVKEKQFEYVMPPTVAADPQQAAAFDQVMAELQQQYNRLVELGVPAEDARYLLPNACATNLVVTMNARSLHHFFELRCCQRAQWEIRQLAEEMLGLVRPVAPLLFAQAGPTCETQGICFEGKMSCGRCPRVMSRLQIEEDQG